MLGLVICNPVRGYAIEKVVLECRQHGAPRCRVVDLWITAKMVTESCIFILRKVLKEVLLSAVYRTIFTIIVTFVLWLRGSCMNGQIHSFSNLFRMLLLDIVKSDIH